MQQGVMLESTEVNLSSLFSQFAVFCKTLLYEPYLQNLLSSTMGIFQYSSARLLDLVSYSIPSAITVIKSLGLLRRPRYIHRGSRRKFIYSSSTIPSITSVSHSGLSGALRHHNKTHVRARYLRPLVCVDTVTPPIQPASAINNVTFMLLNAQSINNKPGLIYETILDRNIPYSMSY